MVSGGDKGYRAVRSAGGCVGDQDFRLLTQLVNHANSLISLCFFKIQHLKQTCPTRNKLHAVRRVTEHLRH